jgi:hypothetical protein
MLSFHKIYLSLVLLISGCAVVAMQTPERTPENNKKRCFSSDELGFIRTFGSTDLANSVFDQPIFPGIMPRLSNSMDVSQHHLFSTPIKDERKNRGNSSAWSNNTVRSQASSVKETPGSISQERFVDPNWGQFSPELITGLQNMMRNDSFSDYCSDTEKKSSFTPKKRTKVEEEFTHTGASFCLNLTASKASKIKRKK